MMSFLLTLPAALKERLRSRLTIVSRLGAE
jgi:hypothetical protein